LLQRQAHCPIVSFNNSESGHVPESFSWKVVDEVWSQVCFLFQLSLFQHQGDNQGLG
jgi:hypothetical protein